MTITWSPPEITSRSSQPIQTIAASSTGIPCSRLAPADVGPLLDRSAPCCRSRPRARRRRRARTLTPKRPAGLERAQGPRAAVDAGEHQRRVERQRGDRVGGRGPAGPSAVSAVITVTPVGKRDIAERSSAAAEACRGLRRCGPGRPFACGEKYDGAPRAPPLAARSPLRAAAACASSPPAAARASRCRRTTRPAAGAEIFATHCGGCHTMTPAGTQGSGNRALRAQGPNFDQRLETYDEVLFAIRNGGFSGAIMPQNIVVGEEADAVATFVADYAGGEVEEPPRPPGAGDESRPARTPSPADDVGSPGPSRPTPAAPAAGLRRAAASPARPAAHPRGPGAGARRAGAGRRRRGPRPPARARRPPPRAAARGRGPAGASATPPPTRSAPPSARAATPRRRSRGCARSRRRIKELEAELERVEADRCRARRDAPEPARPRGPRRRHRRGRRRPARGRRAARLRLRRPRSPRPRPRARADRHGEGRRGLRLAVRLPDRRPGPARARAGPLRGRGDRRGGLRRRSCRRCSSASRRSTGPGCSPASAR